MSTQRPASSRVPKRRPDTRLYASDLDLALDADLELDAEGEKDAPARERDQPMRELEEANLQEIFGSSGPIAALLDGYEFRHSQWQMAMEVRTAILEHKHAVIEAPTGTGKSIAYLLPAILSGKTVVVATANKSLQSQLFTKDIPFIAEVLGREVDAVLVKGRSNYLCTYKWEQELQEQKQIALYDRAHRQIRDLSQWLDDTDTGDVDELPFLLDGDLRPRIVSFADDCLQQACPHFANNCWVNHMRDRAAEAQIIVTNHHLLLNALQFGASGERILPPAAIYVVDEAHGLEQTATSAYEVVVTNNAVDQVLARSIIKELCDEDELDGLRFHASAAFQEAARLDTGSSFVIEGELEEMKKLAHDLEELVKRLRKEHPPAEGENREVTGEKAERAKSLELALEAIASVANKLAEIATPRADGSMVRYGVNIFDRKRVSLELHAAPIDPAEWLARFLFSPQRGGEDLERTVICTSATLSTTGGFAHFKARCGISTPCVERILPPVFDYPRQALLYQPALPAFQYQNSSAYYDAVASEISRLLEVSRGRALCLFTNWSGLQQVQERLRATDHPVRWQVRAQGGDYPRDALLRWFKETPHSVLLATRSFWEGVDIPGDDLSLVVLDKLPFPTPNDPLHAARMKEIDEDGRSSFGDYMLPLMTLALKQGFGRLIRRGSDTGVVAILDERLSSKSYGMQSRTDLPPARFTRNFKDVHRFFQERLDTRAEFGINVWAWRNEDIKPPPLCWRWQLVRLIDGMASSAEGLFAAENGAPATAHANGKPAADAPDLPDVELHALALALQELQGRITKAGRLPAHFGVEVRASAAAIALLDEAATPAILTLRDQLAQWREPMTIALE